MAKEQLVADLECIIEDINKVQEISFDSWYDEEQLDSDTYNQESSVDVAATQVRQQYMTRPTFKKDCKTINEQLAERCIARLTH